MQIEIWKTSFHYPVIRDEYCEFRKTGLEQTVGSCISMTSRFLGKFGDILGKRVQFILQNFVKHFDFINIL